MYEAVQQDKPVVPMKIHLGSDQSIQNVAETALLKILTLLLCKGNVYSEFQEEPLSVLNEADLSWSILTTHVQYTTAVQYSCFRPMNDSPLFQKFKENSEF